MRKNKNEGASLTKAPSDCDPQLHPHVPAVMVTLEGFRQDEEQHWVALLSCGHTQHLRHQPPWQNRQWVQDPATRQALIGTAFACGWCQQAARAADPEQDH